MPDLLKAALERIANPTKVAQLKLQGALSGESETLVVHGTQDPIISQNKAHCLGRDNGQENVLFEVKGAEAVRISEIQDKTPTLKARMGTGGNNIPCVLLDKEEIYASQEKDTPLKHCAYCGGKLERKLLPNGDLEYLIHFSKRKFCNRQCMAKSFDLRHSENVGWSTAHYHARKIIPSGKCCHYGKENAKDVHHKDGNYQTIQ
ncbi:hypothetical protein ACERCG_05205 [Mannheimia sp. E30BD]